MSGYIKIHRELIKKPIWLKSTPEQKAILLTIFLMANHSENEWEWKGEKFKVYPGQFVTSLEAIRENAGKGISIQNVRTSLKRFQKLEFLTNKSTKMGRVISIVNWDSYQAKNKKITKMATKTSQRPNKDLTPNKNERMKEEEIYTRVVEYLNKKTKSTFKPTTKTTINLIKSRIAEGFNPEDFKIVIDKKVLSWGSDPEYCKYLRPATLFGTKFESYLNEKTKPLNNKSKLSPQQTLEKHGL